MIPATAGHVEIEIHTSAFGLGDGESRSIDCPFCSGGLSGGDKNSMSITKKEFGVLYNCFRAGCGESGVVLTNKRIMPSVNTIKKPKMGVPYADKLHKLEAEDLTFLQNKYNIEDRRLLIAQGIRRTDNELLYIPLRDRYGKEVGYLLQDYLPQANKIRRTSFLDLEAAKHRLIMPNRPIMHSKLVATRLSPVYDSCPYVAVVEDFWSALAMSPYCHCVGLGGTHINDEGIAHLGGMTNNLALLLDADTWVSPQPGVKSKTLKLRAKLSVHFDMVKAVYTSLDPKDLNKPERAQLAALVRRNMEGV